MNVCLKPVVWDEEGQPEQWCEADWPCPYHDTDDLSPEQRRQWRYEWSTQWLRDRVMQKHGIGTTP